MEYSRLLPSLQLLEVLCFLVLQPIIPTLLLMNLPFLLPRPRHLRLILLLLGHPLPAAPPTELALREYPCQHVASVVPSLPLLPTATTTITTIRTDYPISVTSAC